MPVNYQGDGRDYRSTVYAGTGGVGSVEVLNGRYSVSGLQIGTNFSDPYDAPAIPVATGQLTIADLSNLTFEYVGAGIPAGGFSLNTSSGRPSPLSASLKVRWSSRAARPQHSKIPQRNRQTARFMVPTTT